ncbi:MAG: GNAT family N-acetyltransferase [Dehalococcoidales bacterium]|nr:GNAT family N-acetyltransferase [Dehalococcoidales bacterium]
MTQNKGDIKIRGMVESDLAKVNEVDRSLFSKGRVTTWPFSFENYWETYHPKLSFVAEVNGEVVGFLVGIIEKEQRSQAILSNTFRAGPLYRSGEVGWIDMIGIREDCWHRGIGNSLVEAFENECRRKNARIRINVRDNDKGLREFLVRLGFVKSEIDMYRKQL